MFAASKLYRDERGSMASAALVIAMFVVIGAVAWKSLGRNDTGNNRTQAASAAIDAYMAGLSASGIEYLRSTPQRVDWAPNVLAPGGQLQKDAIALKEETGLDFCIKAFIGSTLAGERCALGVSPLPGVVPSALNTAANRAVLLVYAKDGSNVAARKEMVSNFGNTNVITVAAVGPALSGFGGSAGKPAFPTSPGPGGGPGGGIAVPVPPVVGIPAGGYTYIPPSTGGGTGGPVVADVSTGAGAEATGSDGDGTTYVPPTTGPGIGGPGTGTGPTVGISTGTPPTLVIPEVGEHPGGGSGGVDPTVGGEVGTAVADISTGAGSEGSGSSSGSGYVPVNTGTSDGTFGYEPSWGIGVGDDGGGEPHP